MMFKKLTVYAKERKKYNCKSFFLPLRGIFFLILSLNSLNFIHVSEKNIYVDYSLLYVENI